MRFPLASTEAVLSSLYYNNNMNKMEDEEKIQSFIEEEKRYEEENNDSVDEVVPPTDIIAFNEQRSCADILRMVKNGQLEINPDFQRGTVWPTRAQSLFIDSLIKQLPIPSLCIGLSASNGVPPKRIVIDGLQRINTIVRFLDSPNDWRLSNLTEIDSRIANKKVSEIKEQSPSILEIIENVSIPITVLRCDFSKPNHMEYLFQIFSRLNTGGMHLYNQEIRNCIFQGTFNSLLKELAHSEKWKALMSLTDERIYRMRFSNEERILKFFAFYDDCNQYDGRLAKFLNGYMGKMRNTDRIEYMKGLFLNTLEVANKIRDFIKIKNAQDSILVGIAKNINTLLDKNEDYINGLYSQLSEQPEFKDEQFKEDVSGKKKMTERIDKAIKIFADNG